MTLFLFVIVGYFACIYQWVQFDKQRKHFQLYIEDEIVYARQLLNGWDWKTNNWKDMDTL